MYGIQFHIRFLQCVDSLAAADFPQRSGCRCRNTGIFVIQQSSDGSYRLCIPTFTDGAENTGLGFIRSGEQRFPQRSVCLRVWNSAQCITGHFGDGFVCQRNIIYEEGAPPLGGNWSKPGFELDYNIYWDASGDPPVMPGGLTLQQWQEKGYDKHSLAADPKFVDPENFDFRLKPDSPALKLGFKPIDTSTVGLVGPPDWLALPKQVKRPPLKLPGEE